MADDREVIHVRGEGGVVYEMTLPLQRHIADRLTKGYIKRVNPDGSEWSDGPAPTKPNVNAPKVEWVGWAVQQGAEPDQAEALTKTDLIEKYGV
jgi:hypothetical protein